MRDRLQEAIELRSTGHAEEARSILLDLVAAPLMMQRSTAFAPWPKFLKLEIQIAMWSQEERQRW